MKKILLLLIALISFTFINAQMTSVDFEDNTTGDWTIQQVNPNQTFYIDAVPAGSDNTTTNYLKIEYDSNLVDQDERLVSPSLDFTQVTDADITFMYMMSYHWGVAPNDNYDINLLVSLDGGTTWTEIWDENSDTGFTSTAQNYMFRAITVDLANYAGEADVQLAFQYLGNDGAQAGIDEIVVTDNTAASTTESTLASSISIFPSVVSDLFTVKNSGSIALVSANIFDVNGRLIISHDLNNLVGEKSINVSNLTAGIYFIEVQSENDKIIKKIIKK